MGYIYKITNLITNKCYIGQTIRKNVNQRWNEHKRGRSCGNETDKSLIKNSIKKYGQDNFKFEIICICFDDDLNRFEIDYISKLNTINPNGYNIHSGGCQGKIKRGIVKHTEEHKRKCIEGRKKYYAEFGHPTKGRKHTEEHKIYISKKLKEYYSIHEQKYKGVPHTEQYKENMRKAKKNEMISVIQLDLDGNFIKEYDSVRGAAKELDLKCNSSISLACRNYNKTCKKYRWMYKFEYILLTQ